MKVRVEYYELRTKEVDIDASIVWEFLTSEVYNPYTMLGELNKKLHNPDEIVAVHLDDEVIYEH